VAEVGKIKIKQNKIIYFPFYMKCNIINMSTLQFVLLLEDGSSVM
jgi:hypothetical protein